MNVKHAPAAEPAATPGDAPVREKFLPVAVPLISEEEIAAVVDVLRSGWIGMGERTLAFERAFAAYVGVPHAVAVSSCTAALHTALLAAGVGPGDEVITTPLTFAATVNMIIATGATPVLADIDPHTLNLSPASVERAITPRTRALLPVHFAGLSCDLDALHALARQLDVALIEDAAHAVGTVHGGMRIGARGNLTCFSFYPTKNMTTIEGGMITTSDAALADEMRRIRMHGLSADAWRRFGPGTAIQQEVVRLGFKYNMTDVAAAIGLGQLARLEHFIEHRERLASRYDDGLRGLPLEIPARPPAGAPDRHSLHLYVVLVQEDRLAASRDEVVNALRAENIGATVHYPAIHQHTYYRDAVRYDEDELRVATDVTRRIISLPLSAAMTHDDVDDVVAAMHRVLARFAAVPGATA
jgi:dTDP-4-amino-4,6-dideoxygalactose transaminase